MCKRDGVAAALILLMVMTVMTVMTATAQPAPPEAAVSAAAADMERARRQAAGPMRIILAAGKTLPGRAPAAQAARPVPAVVVEPAAAPAVVPSAPTAARSPVAPETTPAQSVASPVVSTPGGLNADALQNKAPAVAAPALDTTGTAVIPVVQPDFALDLALYLPAVQTAPQRPRIVSRVEPEVGQRVLDDLGRNASVLVDVTIRPDGRVAAVTPVASMPRPLQRALLDALGQWRFDPLPQERVHRIELFFNREN